MTNSGAGDREPAPQGVPFDVLTPDLIRRNIDAILAVGADIKGEYWGASQFLEDRPGKWLLSFAAWANDRPIGYAILSERRPGLVHLHHFMVAQSWRSRGLGTRMLAEVERRVLAAGWSVVSLKVATEAIDAQRFYRRNGFAQTGREGDYLVFLKELAGAAGVPK